MKTLKTFLKESSSEQDFVNKQYALVKAKIRKRFPRDDQGLYTIKVINELKMIAFGLTTRFGMVSSGGTKFKPSVTALFDILIKDLEKKYKNKQYIKESVLKESSFSASKKQQMRDNFVCIKIDRNDRLFICSRPGPRFVINWIYNKVIDDGKDKDVLMAVDAYMRMETGKEGVDYINPFGELFFIPYSPSEYGRPTYYK